MIPPSLRLIQRPGLLNQISQAFRVNRIVCLLGPRQCGKTTLLKFLHLRSMK